MLNISKNTSVSAAIKQQPIRSLERVEAKKSGKVLLRIIVSTLIFALIMMFIPWTQNIQSNGKVITLSPDQRPQTINSVIPGMIEKWYVKEGDLIAIGDTIAFLSEIKETYMDPNLLSNTDEQIDFKQKTVVAYKTKVTALENQISALSQEQQLKLQQAEIKLQQADLKVQSDSLAYLAAAFNYQVTVDQYERMEGLQKDGLKSLTDLENRNVKVQDAKSYEIAAKNKLLTSKSDYINAKIELSSITAKFNSELAKVQSEKAAAESALYDAEISVNKIENLYANYSKRNSYYYIISHQEGYVTQTLSAGLGETVKEGDPIVTIMPSKYDYAVEMYVEPIDLPLIQVGQKVRIQFDGWPAIVFSGWPNTSYGTYGGKVYAIDKFLGENGKFRILVEPDQEDQKWPDALRFGSGTRNMLLLNDVPIWYELWRNINGFPPDFYLESSETTKNTK